MTIMLKIPTALRRVTDGAESVEVPTGTIAHALDVLDEKFPGFKTRVLDEESGDIHPFISIFLNENDVHYIRGLDTDLKDGDELVIIPAIAGGSLR